MVSALYFGVADSPVIEDSHACTDECGDCETLTKLADTMLNIHTTLMWRGLEESAYAENKWMVCVITPAKLNFLSHLMRKESGRRIIMSFSRLFTDLFFCIWFIFTFTCRESLY